MLGDDYKTTERYEHCMNNYTFTDEKSFEYEGQAMDWLRNQKVEHPNGDGDIAHLSDGIYTAFYGYGE